MSAVSRRCRRWLGVGLTMALGQTARAYVPDGGPYWADGTVTLQLKLGTSPTYGDGTTPNGTATEALRAWNPYMKRVQLSGTIGATGEGGENNRTNEVFFSKTIHGQAFGTNVLAVTMISTTSTQRREADVVVNQKWTWNSYRGYLRPSTQAIDLRRVLEHEFGHVLGLSHPDEAGQYWGALMNSVVSDVDAPTPDDEEGVAFIYGHGVANPATLPALYRDYPYDATVTEGGSAAFSVNVSGGSYPMTYQWFKDGAAIAGATSYSYSLASTELSDAGRYYVVVTNEAGAVTSREAVLTVNAADPPVIYNNVPRDETVVEGQSISFSVGISSGTYPFNYQWFKDDTAIAGATGSSYRLDVANLADAGSYYVVVSNRAGSATSRTTTLTVTPAVPPAFSGDARFIWVSMGHSVFLDAFPDRGSEPFSYQWKKDGVTITDAIARNLYIPETSARDTGNYTLTVTNRAGSATSPIMTVTVMPLPRPPEAIIGIYYDSGDASSVRFSINDLDFSNAPYTFQWYKDGRPIPGAVNLVYILLKPSIADAGDYMVVVTNASGSRASRVVTYTPQVAATAGGWLAAERSGNVAYFLFSNPARIERYDLVQGLWLAPIVLPRTPTAFRPDASGLYVAFGAAVSRFDLNGTNETTLVTVERDVLALFVRDGVLYVFDPDGYIYSNFSSVRLSDRSILAASSSMYGITKPGSLSFAPVLGFVFGRDSGLSPADLHRLTINPDNTFGDQTGSPSTGVYPDASRTFVSPDEALVFENGGTIYRASDMSCVGSLGGAFSDLDFAPEGGTLVLKGSGLLVAYDTAFNETGRFALSSAASRLFISGSTAVVFSSPDSDADSIAATRIALSQLAPRSSLPAVDPQGLAYTPSQIIMGPDNVLYLCDRMLGNVFRWSVASRSYLDPIPLSGRPSFMTYSNPLHTFYFSYGNNRVTQFTLTKGESAFTNSASTVSNLASAGSYLFLVNEEQGWSANYAYNTLGPDGQIVESELNNRNAAEFEWSELTRHFYYLYNNSLCSTEVLANGTIGSMQSSAFTIATLRPPVRVSPDGGTVLLGSGEFFDAATLAKRRSLPIPIDDAAWLGARLYTARETLDGVRVERWGGADDGLDAAGNVPGRLLRLFARPDNGGLVLVVMRDGAPAFVELSADLDDADPVSPSVLVSPVAVQATLGGTTTLSVQAMGGGLTYQWRKDGVDIAGAHAATLTLTDVTTGDVGDYSVIVRNAAGAASSASARITLDHVSFSGFYTGNFGSATAGDFALIVRDDGTAVLLANLPTIDRAVVVTDLRIGADGSFVAGSPAPALTVPSLDAVRFYGGPITGQISGGVLHLNIPALGLNADAARSGSVSLNSSRAGFYQALPINQSHGEIYLVASDSGQAWLLEARAAGARSSAGTLASDGSGVIALDDETLSLQVAGGLLHGSVGNGDDTVTLMPSSAAPGPHRLINISTRGLAGTGENTMIAGFVIGGAQSKDVLIRVLGPALQSVGVNGYLADPRLQIFNQKGVGILSNDNWSSDDPEGIRWATARVGASPPLASNSTDAAILTRLDPGPYTAHVTGADAKSGVVLIEVYDAGSFTVAEPKLVNISTRGWVGSGENVLIAGLVITGDAPKKVLLRALGPALVGEGVKGFLADPGIALYQGPAVIKRNDDWDENGDGEAGLVSAAEGRVGAQPKLGPGSKDAALLLYLKPGVYTLQVSGVNATTGVALVEAYEVGD